ncbi:CPBP family intramembrane metalloprotease [bacterium]|nr:MAG: CPBP family intramembrane metalloprotease [bacterium]
MSQNSLNKDTKQSKAKRTTITHTPKHVKKLAAIAMKHKPGNLPAKEKRHRNWSALFVYPIWVIASFILAVLLVSIVFQILSLVGVNLEDLVSSAALQTVSAAVIYVLSFVIAFGGHYVVTKRWISLETLGLTRLMSWLDIGLAPLAIIVYGLLSAGLLSLIIYLVPAFPADQVQDVGFSSLGDRTSYILAFTTLVIIAPIAEEVLFRGYLYGKLRGAVPIWIAAIVTSIVFGAIHGQWNVAVDVFALSLILCSLREITGSIWAGVLLHMLKNGIAFYFLFIGPVVAPGLGG